MKKYSFMDIVACVLPFLALPVSFSTTALIGEPQIFAVGGILRYSWIMWLFLPIFLVPIYWAVHRKRHGQRYGHLIVIIAITLPLLLIFGSYRFLFTDVDYTTDNLPSIERSVHMDLPDSVKMVTEHFTDMEDFDPYYVSYIKITDPSQAEAFELLIQEGYLWVNQLSPGIKGALPIIIQAELQSFDYFCFYNVTNLSYNKDPNGTYSNCVLLAYDCQLNRLMVLYDFVVRRP